MKTSLIASLLTIFSVSAFAVVDDDLFTGGSQQKSSPKTGADPSESEWDRLLEAAKGPPIKLPATTLSEEQLRIQRREWWKRKAFDAEVARSKAQADEMEVRDFFNEMIPWFTTTGIPLFEQRTTKRCLEIAAGTVRRPAVDFLAARFLMLNKRQKEGVKLLRTVADAPDDAVLPSLARVMAQSEILRWCDIHDKPSASATEARFYELLERHLAEPCSDDDAEVLLAYHLSKPIAEVWQGREARCFEFYKKSKLPDWARFTMGGCFEVRFGWIEIGQGRNPVTDEKKIQSFNERYERARELLTKGWQLRPQSCWAAREMLYVVRHGHGGEGDTDRLWLDRALAACCDFAYAADAYLHTNGRFGGSYDEMLAFGRACVETKRYDSELPAFLNRAVAFIATNLDDWRSIYRSSKFSTLLLDTREKCVAAARTDRGKLLQTSHLLYEAWACGDYQRATKALHSLPVGENGELVTDYDVRQLTHRLNIDSVIPMHDSVLRAGPAHELYEKGVAALKAGQPAGARANFESALAPAGKPGGKFLNALITLTKFQERFATGEWAEVPLDQRLLWHFSEGGMAWRAAEKKARLSSTWEFGKIVFTGALGDSYEVRGHFYSTPPDANRKTAGLSIFCGYSPDTYGRSLTSWWVGRVDTRSTKSMTVDFAPMFGANTKLHVDVPHTKDSTFLMRRDKGHITFVCDKKAIHSEIPADAPSGSGAFGVGIIATPGIGYTDIWNIEARKLTDANRAEKPIDSVKPKPPTASPVPVPDENVKPAS